MQPGQMGEILRVFRVKPDRFVNGLKGRGWLLLGSLRDDAPEQDFPTRHTAGEHTGHDIMRIRRVRHGLNSLGCMLVSFGKSLAFDQTERQQRVRV